MPKQRARDSGVAGVVRRRREREGERQLNSSCDCRLSDACSDAGRVCTIFVLISICFAICVLFDVNLPSDLALANTKPTPQCQMEMEKGNLLANGQPTPRNGNKNNNNSKHNNKEEQSNRSRRRSQRSHPTAGAASCLSRSSRHIYVCVSVFVCLSAPVSLCKCRLCVCVCCCNRQSGRLGLQSEQSEIECERATFSYAIKHTLTRIDCSSNIPFLRGHF